MSDLPVATQQPATLSALAIKKERLKAEMEEARLFEQLGSKVIKVKTRALKALGRAAIDAGIRELGHGRIVVGADNASQAFVKCGEVIDGLLQAGASQNSEAIADLIQLQRDFNKQIIEAGEIEINSTKQPPEGPKGGNVYVAFPPGASGQMVVSQPAGHSDQPKLPG